MTDHVITPDDLEMSALTGVMTVRVPGHPIASTQLEGVLRDARRVERDHRAGELDAEAALAELRDMAPVVDQARGDGPTQAGAVDALLRAIGRRIGGKVADDPLADFAGGDAEAGRRVIL